MPINKGMDKELVIRVCVCVTQSFLKKMKYCYFQQHGWL